MCKLQMQTKTDNAIRWLSQNKDNTIWPHIILTGPQQDMLPCICENIYKLAQNHGYSLPQRYTLQTIDDFNHIDDLQTQDLFSEKRLFQFEYSGKTFNAAHKKKLKTINSSPSNICIWICPSLQNKDKQWLHQHLKANLIPLYLPQKQLLFDLLDNFFSKANLKIIESERDNAYEWILLAIGGDFLRLNTLCIELQLSLQSFNKNNNLISLADIQNQLGMQAEWKVFDWQIACLNGDMNKALQLFKNLSQQAAIWPLITWALADIFRTCIKLHHGLQSGSTIHQQLDLLRIFGDKKKLYSQYFNAFSPAFCQRQLHRLSKVDQLIKQSDIIQTQKDVLNLMISIIKRVQRIRRV